MGFLLLFFNCGTPITQFSFDGETMGTTYNIKIVTDKNFDTKEIKTSIDSWESLINKTVEAGCGFNGKSFGSADIIFISSL